MVWSILAGIAARNLLEGIIDNDFRDNVSTPAIGSVVYCDLAFGTGDHSGIYIGKNRIVHLNGDGIIEVVSPKKFMKRLGGWNSAVSIYVSCDGTDPVGSKKIANRAKSMVGSTREYNFILDNCHQFTTGCINEDFDNSCNFLWMLKTEAEEHIGANTWRVWSF